MDSMVVRLQQVHPNLRHSILAMSLGQVNLDEIIQYLEDLIRDIEDLQDRLEQHEQL